MGRCCSLLLSSSWSGKVSGSALSLLVGRQEGQLACKKREPWGGGVVICLERGADLHMAQLMPLPLTVSCFSEIHIDFTFLVLAHPDSPGKRAIKQVCVCVWEIWLPCTTDCAVCVCCSYWEAGCARLSATPGWPAAAPQLQRLLQIKPTTSTPLTDTAWLCRINRLLYGHKSQGLGLAPSQIWNEGR